MIEYLGESSKEPREYLEEIERLVEAGEYEQALAVIKDLEASPEIDRFTSEALSRLCYLKARDQRFLEKYQKALKSAEGANSYGDQANDGKAIADAQYVLGSIKISLGDLKDAEIDINRALTGFERIQDCCGVINALSRLGQIESIRGNYSGAVNLCHQALGHCRRSEKVTDRATKNKVKRQRTVLLGSLGQRYLRMGQWDKAEKNLQLHVRQLEEDGDEVNLARGLLLLGYVRFVRLQFDQAKVSYEKALAFIKKKKLVRELAIYHEYSGELALAQGSYFEARRHFQEALDIGKRIAPNSALVSQTYRLVAEPQIASKQFEEALCSCNEALKVASSLEERIEIGAIHRALGQIWTAKKDKVRAKECFEMSISVLKKIEAKFELGKAYLEASRSVCFDPSQRNKYRARAEKLFRGLGLDENGRYREAS